MFDKGGSSFRFRNFDCELFKVCRIKNVGNGDFGLRIFEMAEGEYREISSSVANSDLEMRKAKESSEIRMRNLAIRNFPFLRLLLRSFLYVPSISASDLRDFLARISTAR